jgi:hypothetical protein
MPDVPLSDLHDTVRTAIDDAYRRGFEDGQRTLTHAFAAFASQHVKSPQGSFLGNIFADARATPEAAADAAEARERAPRGLLDKILDEVLAPGRRLTIDEVEREVLGRDPRIALKSVYNRLRHYEKTDGSFRRVGGRWQRRETRDISEGDGPLAPFMQGDATV